MNSGVWLPELSLISVTECSLKQVQALLYRLKLINYAKTLGKYWHIGIVQHLLNTFVMMMIIIIIIPNHFIYVVASFNLHNSRKALSPLRINTRWNTITSFWKMGCYKSCIYKCQDSSPHFHTLKTTCPSDVPINVICMILSVTHKHKALEFSSICLSTTIHNRFSSTISVALFSPFNSYSYPLYSGPHCLKNLMTLHLITFVF